MFRRTCARLMIAVLGASAVLHADESFQERREIARDHAWSRSLTALRADHRYELVVSIASLIQNEDRLEIRLEGPHITSLRKILHAGDPDLFISYRPLDEGDATLRLSRIESGPLPELLEVDVSWRGEPHSSDDQPAIETEPNDHWENANPLILGRTLYGSADDADYLGEDEDDRSVDWFRFDVDSESPVLVTFTLDLIDRDVSADLQVFTIGDDGPTPYTKGKDPMEMVHDREPARRSKNLIRTLARGVYYLRVDAKHPFYILRSHVGDVPPFKEPRQAVEAGVRYILNAGDAWLSQVPREGNRVTRSANLHETSLRCTGCHATSFPAEAALAAYRQGYSIPSRDGLRYMVDRIADSPTPLYGDLGLFWQRYIATPLQSQGEQGGVLIDYERDVTGRKTAALEPFGPFLKTAWEGRTTLPEDESNVVPLESKFSMAWRDWKVLNELASRLERDDYAKVAENIARIVTSRRADLQSESLQDRIHRLLAWSLMDRGGSMNKIRRETGALLALQNPDGGWHDSDVNPGPSAVYVTGQLVEALFESGLPREHPAIERAVGFLLDQQQSFGGWIQDGTNENFYTPMRETRHAVIALSKAFPKSGVTTTDVATLPLKSRKAVEVLDALENLAKLPDAQAERWTLRVSDLLDHDSPLVRASAAKLLGSIGDATAVAPLVHALGDHSKVVRRAVAFALRSLGSRRIGIEAITEVLSHQDVRVRRDAVRVFLQQDGGLNEHAAMLDRLIDRIDDSDRLTRFEAVRAVRRSFYRTSDTSDRRRIVEAVLSRMAREEDPILRRNLSENLYILLDENLGGGVSLQKTLAVLPSEARESVLTGRRQVEREALFGPILSSLKNGDEQQRVGILQGFDGSFLKGRTYARQPENAIDVGNDREFGFLESPSLEDLETAFSALVTGSLEGDARLHALQLASFFQIPERTRNAEIQAAVLQALEHADPQIRAEAVRIVRTMRFEGAEHDPNRVRFISRLLIESEEARPPLASAIARNPELAHVDAIAKSLAQLMAQAVNEPELLTLLPEFGGTVAEEGLIDALDVGWIDYDVERKTEALRMVLQTHQGVDSAHSSEKLINLLNKAMNDESETVRDAAYRGYFDREAEADLERLAFDFLRAFDDPSPGIRRLGLSRASRRSSFWGRADALEKLSRLLIDPSTEVRVDSLDVVKHHRLLVRFPILARRVKALAGEPELAARVNSLLNASGIDPSSTVPDVALDRPFFLDREKFRTDVNPLFYQPGADGYSCVDCHANHSILRLAEVSPDADPRDEDVASNFASVSKVVDLLRPESSLLLRKPLSDQGRADSEPTEMTHDGGRRWTDEDDPVYRAILSWIRASAALAGEIPPLNPFEAEVEDLSPVEEPSTPR